jgi:pimeloyl-ACP methyl ester carboxylesterase
MFFDFSVFRPVRRHVLTALAVAVTLLGHEVAIAATTTVNLYLVDPFLLGTLDNGATLGNLNLGTLYLRRNWTTVQAAGLVADSTSAAIAVVQTSNGTGSVKLTATDGAVLLPYNAKFLAQAPAAGSATLTVPAADLVKVGSVYFAAALVQAPPAGAAHSFSTSIAVTATQNSVRKQATMSLSPPPVVLVHGLWGDATSLQDLDAYLLATAPWKQSGLVEPVCYSLYLAFDAATDPLPRDGDSCEVTSKTALDNEIGHLMAVLDNRHIVGGRIDMVAHSMGGLVARHYSALSEYSGARNRGQGAFHELVTLDTPEQGSALANYLYDHASSGLEAPLLSPSWNLWEAQCDSDDTVRACFNKLGLPLAASSLTLKTGAVYSLIPGGHSLTAAPDPRIPGTIWRAVTATWSQNDRPSSLLRSVLNALITAIYKGDQTPASTVGILGTELNDVIVTTKSQLGDAPQSFNFRDLAHTKTPDPSILGIFFDGVNQNVEESASVDRLAGCWLASLGAVSCTQGIVQPAEAVAKVAAVAPKPAKFLATERLAMGSASRAPQFGVPFELPLRFGNEVPDTIVVSQSDGHGEVASGSGAVAIARQAGGVSFIRITPRRFGPMKFTVAATFADGGVALRSFTADVRLPATSPTAFTAGRSPMVIVLNSDEPVALLQPEATYPNVGTVRLAPRLVTSTVEQSAGAPAISLQGGVIRALRPGTATIDARFGGSVDRVQVIVKPNWE